MTAIRTQISPWPAKTPGPPLQERASKRRKLSEDRVADSSSATSISRRDDIADWDQVQAARTQCELSSDNSVESCFPTTDTVVLQHQFAAFVWNGRLPDFTQTNLVNIYLFHGDSRQQIFEFRDQPSSKFQAGLITAPVNDSWWTNGDQWNGQNLSFPYFWLITRNDHQLDGSETPQAQFHAVQTTFADSVIASMSSTAAAASSASAASASSASAASASSASAKSASAAATSGSVSGSANVQSGASSSSFPHWAIAVIVVLGFLAIVATCTLFFFILRRVRRRDHRDSMGSNSPMMAHVGNSPQSPLLAAGAIGGAAAVDLQSSSGHGGHGAPSVVSPDGASTISRAGSAGEGGPFSGADAAIMAKAFRQALRQPDFAGRPVEEGESPENAEHKEELLNRELAEEGRDIRSVSSSRGVRVETMTDDGTTTDNPH